MGGTHYVCYADDNITFGVIPVRMENLCHSATMAPASPAKGRMAFISSVTRC